MDTLLNMPLSEAIAIKIDWLIAEYDDTRDVKFLESIREMQELTRTLDYLEDLYEGKFQKEVWM